MSPFRFGRPLTIGVGLLATLGLGLLTVALVSDPFVAGAAAADAPKPTKPDTKARLRPKEVKLTASVSPADAKPGDTVTYTVTADVAEPWHIYAYAPKRVGEGPEPTQFDFFDRGGLKLDGEWTPDRDPEKKKESVFAGLEFVEFYEGKVSWSVPLKVPANAKPGKINLRSQIHFQICDPKSCKPPAKVTVPDAPVTIKAGDSASLGPQGKAAIIAALSIGAVPPNAAPAAAKPKVAGSIQQAIDKGLFSFLLLSAAGGFFAVLMPCVWPMVPITVNFFVKQGQVKNGRPTLLAVTYCLSIIAIFTLVGLLCSIFLGASSLTQLGSNPWLNALVAITFLAFGLSLLGLFEIRLPSFLLNASSQGESRGGLIGVVFMALTLTISSFTCTFPVVGGLLVMASRGNYFYPILGMLTFATVLALPFFLLALAPGLLARMPRSGDWMNTVKVVGGLIEIGAAFKFVNTAEIGFGATPANAWFDAQVVLSIWVIMLIVCGIYLLGLFRTDHDHDAIKVGPVRLLAGTLFCGLGLYLAPALFGFPPKSKFYDTIVGILPADSGELNSKAELAAIPCPPGSVVQIDNNLTPAPEASDTGSRKATSSDPAKATREERRVHGVAWGMSLDAALEEAKAKKRPVLIDFTGVNCANCRTMEQSVFPRPDVVEQLRRFVTVSLYTDQVDIASLTHQQRLDLAEANLEKEADLIDQTSSPYYVILDLDGKVIASTGFDNSAQGFRDFLKSNLEKFEKEATQKVASAP